MMKDAIVSYGYAILGIGIGLAIARFDAPDLTLEPGETISIEVPPLFDTSHCIVEDAFRSYVECTMRRDRWSCHGCTQHDHGGLIECIPCEERPQRQRPSTPHCLTPIALVVG